MKYYGPGTNYAAGYCNAMVGGLKAGAWFMPSYKDIVQISYYWDKLNNSLKTMGWDPFANLTNRIVSVQYDDDATFRIILPDRSYWSTYKTEKHKFFCATSYGDSSIWKQIEASEPEPDLSVTCEVGDILYSDLKCYDETPSGLTAIGVVFDTENRLAVSTVLVLSPQWGGWADNIPNLKACEFESLAITTCAADGKANTKAIVDYYGDSSDYAAGYCHNYTTKGTNKGDWFLPSMKELVTLSGVTDVVEASLDSVGVYDSLFGALFVSSTVARYRNGEVIAYALASDLGALRIVTYPYGSMRAAHRCVINY